MSGSAPQFGSPPVRLAERASDAHKGNFGRALLVGGSRGMCGSIALSAVAALKTGSGLVTAAVPDRCLETVAAFHPCVMTRALADDGRGRFALAAAADIETVLSGASAVGCGPGMTVEAGSVRLVERLLQTATIPRVLDADALNVLATFDWKSSTYPLDQLVLTPHPGEMQRLCGVASRDRRGQVSAAAQWANRHRLVVILKGGPTIVVGPDQQWTSDTGNPGMATGGSGDVLTGILTSLLGQGLSAWDASRLAVWLHGAAGDLAAAAHGQAGMTAAEILDALPQCLDLAAG